MERAGAFAGLSTVKGEGAVSVCPSVSCKIQKSKLNANKHSLSPT